MFRKHILVTFLTLFAIGSTLIGQAQELTWRQLKEVTFEKEFDPDEQLYFKIPQFSNEIKKLEGKKVTIKGYLIPVDLSAGYNVISANPFNSCYFCGNAGPESVMELELAGDYSGLRMDQYVTVEGILRLNDTDVFKLPYRLEQAEIIDVE